MSKRMITREGFANVRQELEYLRVCKRKEIAEKLREARAHGDLSENAEYDAAMDEQREVEARIKELEDLYMNVQVVDLDASDIESVRVGCVVDARNVETGTDYRFRIVDTTEARSLQWKISGESPVGRALTGRRVGEEVRVNAPAGVFTYRVLRIEAA